MSDWQAVPLGNATALEAWEPPERCLISCKIFDRYDRNPHLAGHLAPPKEIWMDRTYEIYRDGEGWRVDFGEGRHEPLPSWQHVVSWFCKMSPRAIEIIIE